MLGDLLLSVLQQVEGADLDPMPETRLVAPGEEVAWDDACGQVWVRLISQEPVFTSGAQCPFALDLTIGVGVIRCVAVLDDRGIPPTPGQITADGVQIARDSWALYQALACFTPTGAARANLEDWTPLGPSGASAGGEWTLTARVI